MNPADIENQISSRLENIRDRVGEACRKSGRNPGQVKLVAVTKTVSPETVTAAIKAGLTIFGENYVQEAQKKIGQVGRPASWHFIGHLQSNKAGTAVQLFDLIHSVDSEKLALELNKWASASNRRLPVLIQVNLGGEKSKSGATPEKTGELAEKIAGLPHLDLQGLMTLPPFFDQPEKARPYFSALRELRDRLGPPLVELSMGMTGDYEAAVEEGATIIRLGTALFGPRPVRG